MLQAAQLCEYTKHLEHILSECNYDYYVFRRRNNNVGDYYDTVHFKDQLGYCILFC